MGYGLDCREIGVNSQQVQEIFLFPTATRQALEPSQASVQSVPGTFPPGVKQPKHQADHTPLSSTEVKNGESIYLFSPMRLYGVVLRLLRIEIIYL
jgi:hypothetical protein